MEMGQPPAVGIADPAVWVHSRQYTGRLVTVTNGVIFAEPVYNYSREFPYLWEEIVLPISYDAERVLLDAACTHAVSDAAATDSRDLHALRDDRGLDRARRVLADHRQLAGTVAADRGTTTNV